MADNVLTPLRSYTLSLFPAQGGLSHGELWSRLFETHRAVCEGARIFGEMFLNLRGGLSPDLVVQSEDHDVKGRRRVLALGWLSVEDDLGAKDHPHRVQDVEKGTRLSHEKASQLLRAVLCEKGITDSRMIEEWWNDCAEALTANVRDDTVWVNRAAAFQAMQPQATPDEAWMLLTRVFGQDFIDLRLAQQVKQISGRSDDSEEDGDEDQDLTTEQDEKTPKSRDPSNKGRQVFCDLFGTGSKGDFTGTVVLAEKVLCWMDSLGKEVQALDESDIRRDLTSIFHGGVFPPFPVEELKKENPKPTLLYPSEASSGKRPSNFAKLTRRLLVRVGAWDPLDGEHGARDKPLSFLLKRFRRAAEDELKKAHRVLLPDWAKPLRKALLQSTLADFGPLGGASSGEFGYLFVGLAARRMSQTHSWLKLNEQQRHIASVRKANAEEKLHELDPNERAQSWLKDYENRRKDTTGSEGDYRITPRAITGFDDLLAKWCKVSDSDARADALELMQSQVEKFGDQDLFLELAKDEARCVWLRQDGTTTPDILKHWVELRRAENDETRLKIPRYCHPDPFHHPTFCEYGDASKPKAQYSWKDPMSPRDSESGGEKDKERIVWLYLLNPSSRKVSRCPLRWHSKRLWKDLGGDPKRTDSNPSRSSTNDIEAVRPRMELSRNDRLGRAAIHLSCKDNHGRKIVYRPAYPFSEKSKGWNARLQADRFALERLSAMWDEQKMAWKDGGRQLLKLRWFLTFGPSLVQCRGPWVDYANLLGLAMPSFRTDGGKLKPILGVHKETNKTRTGHAKLILCRLPGLRVLSVDLGHRYAASCAVWETLSSEEVAHACKLVGQEPPGSNDVYLHLHHDADGQEKTTIYRRIGPDFLDGQEHEAPWARLDRQFSIKLQGEEAEARRATDEEIERVKALEADLGKKPPEKRDLHVQEVMSDAVWTCRLGLRRHGDIARIAYSFIAADRLLPGGRMATMTGEDRREALAVALSRWHDRKTSTRWIDEWARDQWRANIEPHLAGVELKGEAPQDETAKQRKDRQEDVRRKLEPLAAHLAQNQNECQRLYDLWAHRWAEEDKLWRQRLRWLRDWILPRGSKASSKTIRRVGGLSLTRITTIQGLYRVQKAFKNKPLPENPRANIPDRWDDSLSGFGKRILDTVERMRENRVKQIASRIVEAALGVGIERNRKGGYQKKRPLERVDDPRFAPCHAIVIENLEHYRTDELQTRRENRQLMSWSSGKIRDHLKQACELYGLKFWQVLPHHTSQQDSRTGAPGLRCNGIPIKEFTSDTGFWQSERKRAETRLKKNRFSRDEENARDWYLIDLYCHLRFAANEAARAVDFVTIPKQKGGALFVSSDPNSPAAKGIQADLNAAANIGLKALMDPDWPGKWWSVPCDRKTLRPVKEKVDGCTVLDTSMQLKTPEDEKPAKRSSRGKLTKQRDIVNLWRDVSAQPIKPGEWEETKAYWAKARYKVIQILRKQAEMKTDDEMPKPGADFALEAE